MVEPRSRGTPRKTFCVCLISVDSPLESSIPLGVNGHKGVDLKIETQFWFVCPKWFCPTLSLTRSSKYLVWSIEEDGCCCCCCLPHTWFLLPIGPVQKIGEHCVRIIEYCTHKTIGFKLFTFFIRFCIIALKYCQIISMDLKLTFLRDSDGENEQRIWFFQL